MAFTELVGAVKEICQSYEGDSRAQVPLSKFKEGKGTDSLCTEGLFGPLYVGIGASLSNGKEMHDSSIERAFWGFGHLSTTQEKFVLAKHSKGGVFIPKKKVGVFLPIGWSLRI